MVGAETMETFERAKVLLEKMGKSVNHCGGVGTGQAVKICNNMLLAVSMIGVAETMNLGQKYGRLSMTNGRTIKKKFLIPSSLKASASIPSCWLTS